MALWRAMRRLLSMLLSSWRYDGEDWIEACTYVILSLLCRPVKFIAKHCSRLASTVCLE